MSGYETLLRGQEEIKTLYRQQIELAKELKDIINAFGDTYQAGLNAALKETVPGGHGLSRGITERVREVLERLRAHREFIYWGDGSPSDLDAYIDAELSKLERMTNPHQSKDSEEK